MGPIRDCSWPIGLKSGTAHRLVARWKSNVEPVVLELIPNVLEALILRERDRARIAFALELAWRVVGTFPSDMNLRVRKCLAAGPCSKWRRITECFAVD